MLDHAAFSKTVNARASLGTGRTSRVHSVVLLSPTWLCVPAPAPVLLSGFYLSWRASSTRNAILLPVLGSVLGPLLGTLLSGGTAKLSVDQAFSGLYLPNMSTHIILNGSPSKGRDVALTLRGRRPQPVSSESLQYSVEAHANTGMQCSS